MISFQRKAVGEGVGMHSCMCILHIAYAAYFICQLSSVNVCKNSVVVALEGL